MDLRVEAVSVHLHLEQESEYGSSRGTPAGMNASLSMCISGCVSIPDAHAVFYEARQLRSISV